MCYKYADCSVDSYRTETCDEYDEACTKLQHVEDAMERIIKMLYGTEDFDRSDLDEAIHDICDVVDVKSPTGLPRVRRLRSNIFEFAADYSQNTTHAGV